MNDLAHRLRRAAAEGIALAALGALGCGPVIPTKDLRSSTDGGIQVVLRDGGADPGYPTDLLVCHGPDRTGTGYYGRCCTMVSCYTPADGICALKAPSEIGLPPGSGSCPCPISESTSAMTQGPFGPNPGHTPNKAGSCCYLFGSIACDGRPMIVEGAVVTAPVVTRPDWT